MDIAALSMGISQMKVAQQASVAVMNLAMDTGKTQTNDLLQMIEQAPVVTEQSVNSHIGGNIDIKL